MYNENKKREYLLERTQPGDMRESALSLFELLSPYEQKYDVDVSSRDEKLFHELLEVYPDQDKIEKTVRYSILIDYLRWAAKKDGIVEPDVETLGDIYGLQKTRTAMIDTPQRLKKYLDEIFKDEYVPRSDCLYKCACWLAFMGVAEKDIPNVLTSDIDFNTLTVSYNGKKLPICIEAYKPFKVAVESEYFMFQKYPTATKLTRVERIKSEYLLRGAKSVPQYKTIQVELSQKAKERFGSSAQKLTLYNIRLSGLFYRTYMEERQNSNIDFEAFIKEEIPDNPDKRASVYERRRVKSKDLKKKYAIWKLAFWN